MIKLLKIKNIKCFQYQEFAFAPLTVLCGANSAGKSTVIQSLLLLRQSFNADEFAYEEIGLVGEYVSLGHLSDVISHGANESHLMIQIDELQFNVDLDIENKEEYRMKYTAQGSLEQDIFLNPFIYLSAERLGPRSSYDVSFDTKRINLGIYGEYAMAEFIKNASIPTKNKKLAAIFTEANTKLEQGDGKNRDLTLEIAVKTVMRKICPGFDISYDSHKTVDKVSNGFSSSSTKLPVRPINSGFGVSCVFPIIVAAFCLEPGGTLIVENPEVHLHPSAQSELAQFLAAVSSTGVQVILETHSDHIINGIRIYAKDNSSMAENIAINSIDRNANIINVQHISIDVDGNLSAGHDGFFDQAEKDLLRLF